MSATVASIREILTRYAEQVKKLSDEKSRLSAENASLVEAHSKALSNAASAEEMHALALQELADFKAASHEKNAIFQAEIDHLEAEIQSFLAQLQPSQ
jgi:hypothetical protein